MSPLPLTLDRITSLLAACRTPEAAARASDRAARLARSAQTIASAAAFASIAVALDHHRLALVAVAEGDLQSVGGHTRNRNAEAQYAVNTAARAA